MRVAILLPVMLAVAATGDIARSQTPGAPESFGAQVNVTDAKGAAAAANIRIDIQQYTPDRERVTVENALKSGGYEAFLTALRQAPQVGSVTLGDRTWAIRWAREKGEGHGRTIVVVTDQPIYFVGGGRLDAKPRAGYEVAVIRLQVDSIGLGKGVMAAATKVRTGEMGVEIEDYGDNPVELVTVKRRL
jgi:hypothetical protein